MRKMILFGCAVALLAACNPKIVEVVEVETVETVESSEFPTAEIAEGSQLYMDYCGKCHKHKTVTDFNQDQWRKIVPNMAAKSKLDAIQESKVLEFVLWKTETK